MRVNLTAGEISPALPAGDRAGTSAATGDATFAASLARLTAVSAPAAASARAATTPAAATPESGAQPTGSKSAKPRNETYQPVEGEPY